MTTCPNLIPSRRRKVPGAIFRFSEKINRLYALVPETMSANPMYDLTGLSIDQLKQLNRDITNALEGYDGNRRRQAQKEIKEICKKYGYELKDLFGERIKPDFRKKST